MNDSVVNASVGYNQFQNMSRRVAEFRENWFTDVEKSVDGERKEKTVVKYI